MPARSPFPAILIILLILITFPFWIGLFGLFIGLIGGFFGVLAGIMGGIFGAMGAIIAIPFKILFHWNHPDWAPHFHTNGCIILAVIILIVVLSKRK